MLSDEEKQAIKVLNHFNPVDCGREDTQAIETILNLIEKQSKEIEELNRKVKIKEADIDIFMKKLNKAWIYKIKAKIEEYDDKGMTVNLVNRSAGKTFQQAVHYEVKKVLQSLLEI